MVYIFILTSGTIHNPGTINILKVINHVCLFI